VGDGDHGSTSMLRWCRRSNF